VEQIVDPAVSKVKFDRQLADVRGLEKELAAKGCWIISASFPHIIAAFSAPKLRPPSVVFGVRFDFSNYDLHPPSVRLIDPFSREPYIFSRLPTHLNRAVSTGVPGESSIQPLMQASHPNDIPFFCIPGVREYHEHPGHTGDSWLLHRNTGEGTLYFLLDQLLKYGIEPITAYDMALKISIQGYNQALVPE
jgi:hypothetical protein